MHFKTRLKLNEVIKKGKSSNWTKPDCCSQCGGRIWWHGFRLRWCGSHQIYVRRFICPECRSSHTLLPSGFWPRFQASIYFLIRSCLMRLKRHRWHPLFKRQRIRWWILSYQRLLTVFNDLKTAIKKCLQQHENRAPLSRWCLTHPRVS